MDQFVNGFETLQLSTATPADYKGAEQFARQFKKCAAIEPRDVSYSTTAGAAMTSETNQHQYKPY